MLFNCSFFKGFMFVNSLIKIIVYKITILYHFYPSDWTKLNNCPKCSDKSIIWQVIMTRTWWPQGTGTAGPAADPPVSPATVWKAARSPSEKHKAKYYN